MCRPEHFAVSYAINPWMDPPSWARDERAHAAAREWTALYRHLVELGAAVELVPPVPGMPDLVFTANAAVVLDRQVLLARFRHPERRPRSRTSKPRFSALQARGLVDSVRRLPGDVVLEGAGDCVFDRRPRTCSGWATGSAPMRPRGTRERPVRRTRSSYSSSRIRASITWTRRSLRCSRGEVMYVPTRLPPPGSDHPRPGRGRIASSSGWKMRSRLAANAVAREDTLSCRARRERLRRELEDARLPRADDAAAHRSSAAAARRSA